MYHLVSPEGNVHRHTDSERKRDALLRTGYTEVEEACTRADVGIRPYGEDLCEAASNPSPTERPRRKAANKAAVKSTDKEVRV